MFHDIRLTSDHLAVTTVKSPDSATRSHIDVMNTLGFELTCASDVVNVKRIATINNDVIRVYSFDKLMQHGVDETRGYHQPNRAGRLQFRDKTIQRRSANRSLGFKRLHCLGIAIVGHALVTPAQKASHHIGAHAAESNHSNLHSKKLLA
jgi:hypothetical protein